MANNKKSSQPEALENVQEVVSTNIRWIEKYQNVISYGVLGMLAVVVAVFAIINYVIKPKSVELNDEIAYAAFYFAQGDYERALNGDEADCIGFAEIAEGNTLYQAGKLASLYAGICCYHLGQYDEAIDYLKNFSAKDVNIGDLAKQFLGDAYVQTEQYEEAIKAFKAAASRGNEIIAPASLKKAGLVYLELDDKKEAERMFTQIKENYMTSREAQDIDKYIALTK